MLLQEALWKQNKNVKMNLKGGVENKGILKSSQFDHHLRICKIGMMMSFLKNRKLLTDISITLVCVSDPVKMTFRGGFEMFFFKKAI